MRFNRRESSAQPAGEMEPLEERLQTLVELERGSRDMLEQREAERLATEKAESERRIAEVDAALADLQTQKHEHGEARRRLAEMDSALADAWSQIKRLAGEVSEARRETEVARKELKPRSEQKVAAAERALVDAHAEIERERKLRGEVEQRQAKEAAEAELRIAELEEMLTQARAEAEQERRQRADLEQQLAERDQERERLLAIERQLKALVGAPGDSNHAVREHGQEDPEILTPEPPPPSENEELEVPPLFETLQPVEPAESEPTPAPARRVGRRRRQSRKHTAVCVVCKRTVEGESWTRLAADGWVITDDTALCPDCRREGWQLPEGGGLPFRRSVERQTSS